ncbi:MAG: phytanoyl-CoA dioxygenase family protein [Pseudomonadota bacterium]
MADTTVANDGRSIAQWLGGRSFEDWSAQYNRDGYIIFENVMAQKDLQRVRDALLPHMEKTGRNNFEGYKSNRVYALLAKSPDIFSEMVTHPLALAFAEADLGRSCLLSALLAINLHPGETVQGWHYDDGHLQIPKPRPAYGVSTFWAIDETTDTNGATELLPGSHLWGPEHDFESVSDSMRLSHDDPHIDPAPHPDAVKAVMPAGSLMIAKGTLLHRGGANLSSSPRLIVTPQYCSGWARQLENMVLATPPGIAAKLPRRARELIGYSIHGDFMGYVDGGHPDKVLPRGV